MGLWFYLVAFISLYIFLQGLRNIIRNRKLPPSPPTIPFIGNIFWLLKSSKNFADLEPVLRSLRSKYGDIVTLHIGSTPSIFITSHEAAHRALVKNGTVFASRPSTLQIIKIFFPEQHTITTSPYGPVWRFLRQNFMQITQPSRLNSYSHCRKWALNVLKKHILVDIETGNKAIPINDYFNLALSVLLSYMCLGEKFDLGTVKNIQRVHHRLVNNFIRFNVLNFLPVLTRIVFRRLWREVLEIRENQVSIFLPIIKARHEKIKSKVNIGVGDHENEQDQFEAYVDTLLDMKLPDSGNKLTDEELVSLCSEFLLGGTDTTATTFLWVMANLVKYQNIQEKLFDEIKEVVKHGEDIEEEHLKRMSYLKAVVLETLRRHPPGHFILPRAVTQDTVMDGHTIPKNAMVNFPVAELGLDPNVWEDPMEFRPERFLRHEEGDAEFDLKGFKEIKMMPFGAGRRVCPAISMAMIHLEYFVANLVRDFKWTLEDGCEVDMSEKQAFTIVMKNPLRPCVSPRLN